MINLKFGNNGVGILVVCEFNKVFDAINGVDEYKLLQLLFEALLLLFDWLYS